MKNIIVSLGAGLNQIPLIKSIKSRGFKCLAFDKNPNALGFEIADYSVPISSHDYQGILDYIKKENFEDKIAGVLTRSTGEPVLVAAKLAKYLGLKYMEPEIAEIIIDKSKLLRKLNELDIPSPKVIVTDGWLPKDIEFPVFVKPSKTVLSHTAMRKCYDFEELKNAIKKAVKISDNNKANVEEFLTGYDIVSIDFVDNGKIIHVCNIGELTKGEPDFVGAGWYTAFKDMDEIVERTVKEFVRKLKIKNGFFQIAMKVSEDLTSAKIYEIHGEIGGDYVSDVFIPFSFNGCDLFSLNLNYILNMKSFSRDISLFRKGKSCVILVFNFNRLESFVKEQISLLKFYEKGDMLSFLKKLENYNVFFKSI